MNCKIEINSCIIVPILLPGIGLFTLLGLLYLNLCNRMRYIAFNTRLNLLSKKKPITESYQNVLSYLSVIMLGLFLSECGKEQILLNIVYANLNFGCVVSFVLKVRKIIAGTIYVLLFICLFSIAVTPATSTLCTLVFQIGCLSFTKKIPSWLPMFLIILSNDIHVNPGPHFHNSFLNFMNWNLNSLAKENFGRVQLIEAHNSIFNYDFISICETSLNDSVELPETLLDDYIFVPANNPANTRHGGVGLFYKTSLPVIARNDLSFDESIVVELNFGKIINICYCFIPKSFFQSYISRISNLLG